MLRTKFLVLLILCACLLAACSAPQDVTAVEFATKPEASYETTEVVRGAFDYTVKVNGTVVYMDTKSIACEYDGAILTSDVLFSDKDTFKKGDVIATFTFETSQAELERMELEYYQANRSAALQIESYEKKIDQYAQAAQAGGTQGQIAALQMKQAQNDLTIYKEKTYASLSKQGEALEAYRDKFTEKTLVAPEDGMVIGSISLKAGTSFSKGSPLLSYTTGTSKLLLLNNTSTELALLSTPGMKVTISRADQSIEGSIVASPAGIDDILSNENIYVHSDDLDTLEPRSYYTVTCTVLELQDMLLLDADAVHYDENAAYVMLLQDGQAIKKQILCGLESGRMICVLDGLTEGQQVITNY